MIGHFVAKEIIETLSGPKFLITFFISLALIVTSVYSGYQLYTTEQNWHSTALAQNKTAMQNLGSYGNLKITGTKAMRSPKRLSIFVKGVDSSIGKAAAVRDDPNIVLRDSRFGLNPIFAVFGELDMAFIVKIILALFALLFSYNAISGEREMGTLKLVLSNSVGRSSFIIGKSIGGILTLLLTFLVPFLISLLMLLIVFNVNFSVEEWARIGMIALVYSIYLAVFYMIGMFMSALTRNSFVSFLLCLLVWVLSVTIIPRIAVEAAGQLSPAPSIDVVEAKRAALQRSYFADLETRLQKSIEDAVRRNAPREEVRAASDAARKESRALIADEVEKILSEYRQQQINLRRTAQNLARLSPTSCATFATNRLTFTDAELRERFLDSLGRFQTEFIDYADNKIKEYPELSHTGTSISTSIDEDDEGNRSWSVRVRTPSALIDVGDSPAFTMENETLEASAAAVVPDIAILAIELVLFFALSFVAFIRYDVR